MTSIDRQAPGKSVCGVSNRPLTRRGSLVTLVRLVHKEPFEVGNFHAAAHDQRRTLMNTLRLNIQYASSSVDRCPSGLFRKECDWVRFVQQAQFAFAVCLRWRARF